MQTTSGYFTDRNGDRKSGQLVYVYLGASLATIYEAGTTTAKANPFLSDATGAWSFTAANDDYIVYKIENGVISQITDTNTTYTTDYTPTEIFKNWYIYPSLVEWTATSFTYDGTVTQSGATGSAKMSGNLLFGTGSPSNQTVTGDLSQFIVVPSGASQAKIVSVYVRLENSYVGTLQVNSSTITVNVYAAKYDTGAAEALYGTASSSGIGSWVKVDVDISSSMVNGGDYMIRVEVSGSINAIAIGASVTNTLSVWADNISLMF